MSLDIDVIVIKCYLFNMRFSTCLRQLLVNSILSQISPTMNKYICQWLLGNRLKYLWKFQKLRILLPVKWRIYNLLVDTSPKMFLLRPAAIRTLKNFQAIPTPASPQHVVQLRIPKYLYKSCPWCRFFSWSKIPNHYSSKWYVISKLWSAWKNFVS